MPKTSCRTAYKMSAPRGGYYTDLKMSFSRVTKPGDKLFAALEKAAVEPRLGFYPELVLKMPDGSEHDLGKVELDEVTRDWTKED